MLNLTRIEQRNIIAKIETHSCMFDCTTKDIEEYAYQEIKADSVNSELIEFINTEIRKTGY
jgi:hypothetical protein